MWFDAFCITCPMYDVVTCMHFELRPEMKVE